MSDAFFITLLYPFLHEFFSVHTCEWSVIGNGSCSDEDIAEKQFDLLCKYFNCLLPSNLLISESLGELFSSD